MPTLKEQVEAVVADLVLNEARLDLWVNGDDTTDFTASDGVTTVPSIRKFIAETFKFQGTYASGGTAYTVGQTFLGATGDDQYRMFRVTTNFTSTTFAGDVANYETLFDFAQVVTDATAAKDAAEAAQTAVEAIFDSFDDRYLGTFASDPTLDNDGNPLADGAIYWNTTTNVLKFYDLGNTIWVDPVASAQAGAAASEAWANTAEDTLVPASAGGNEVDEYSAKHHANKASDSATDAANSAAAAAAVPAPQLNRKADTAGVWFSGHLSVTPFMELPAQDELSIVLKIPHATPSSGTGLLVALTDGTTLSSNCFLLNRDTADNRLSIYIRDKAGNTYIARVNNVFNTTGKHVVVTITRSAVEVYIDGVPAALSTSGVFSNDVDSTKWTLGGSIHSDVHGLENVALSGVGVFNRILSSTEAAAIYTQGIQSWLAANPENKWADGTEYYISDFSAGADGFLFPIGGSIAGNVDSIGGEDDTLEFTTDTTSTIKRAYISVGWISPNVLYNIDFDCYVPASNVSARGVRVADGSNGIDSGSIIPTPDTWQHVSYSGVGTSSNRLYFQVLPSVGQSFVGVNGDVAYIKNIRVTRAGCLACLPMDEGIGYQLHDLSDNRYDALLSTTGFQHLKPKHEGFIRAFHIDAYNGGAGNVELLSSSRDILPADVIVTNGVVFNYVAAPITAGAILVRRSDRTNKTTVMSNSDLLGVDDAMYMDARGEVQEPPTHKNINVNGSTDADLTDIDIRVNYQKIN